MSDLRRWMNAVSPLTTLTEAAAIPTLYRGFGSGKGQRYKGKEWGDAVYLTSDLQIATWYGQQGGVKRAHVPRLHVISASDAMTEQIADSVSPSTTARRLGVDAIYNASKHWVNRISPYEFILFAKDQVSFSPLSSEETAEYDRVKALLSEAPRDLRRWIMLCERWETLPRLFHGTCQHDLPIIRQRGLQARPTKPKGGAVRHGVYLTDDYHTADEYGFLACDQRGGGDVVILEIDGQQLDVKLLQPDDYDLQDAIQGGELAGSEPVDPRLRHLRHWSEASWELSLEMTHQVFYAGTIPVAAITVLDAV